MLVPVDRPHWIFRGRIGSKKVRPIRGDLQYIKFVEIWLIKQCLAHLLANQGCVSQPVVMR